MPKRSLFRNPLGISFFLHAFAIFAVVGFYTLRKPPLHPIDISLSGGRLEVTALQAPVDHAQSRPSKTLGNERLVNSASISGASLVPASHTKSEENSHSDWAAETRPTTGLKGLSDTSAPQNTDDFARNTYIFEMQKRIQAQERYPLEAKKRGDEDTVLIYFELNGRGEIIEIRAISPVKSHLLQDAALAAVREASPFSPPPAGSLRVFKIPIEFKIK